MAELLTDARAQHEGLGTLRPKTVERHGESLLALIAVTREQAAAKLLADAELSGEQTQRLRELQNFVQARAAELQLPSGYLAPPSDLLEVLRRGAEATLPVLTGWLRRECGDALRRGSL